MPWSKHEEPTSAAATAITGELRPLRPRTARGRPAFGRNFEAGAVNNLTASMPTMPRSPDEDIRMNLQRVRARSRWIANNDPHAKLFLSQLDRNVLGPAGIVMRPDVRNGDDLDEKANKALSEAWARWCRAAQCDYLGESSFVELQRMALRTMAEDGEILVQHVAGRGAGDFGYQLLLIDPERLSVDHNEDLRGGSYVRLGIEFDANGRRVAYYIRTSSRSGEYYSFQGGDYQRVLAENITHLFLRERVGQNRGMPWSAATLIRLSMLNGYSEGAVTNARAAANKYPVIEAGEFAEPFVGDDTDENDNPIIEAGTPGEPLVLPYGYKLSTWDPRYPQSEYGPFTKSMIQEIAAGNLINYPTQSGDLQGVSWSGLRHGQQQERDLWIVIQQILIERLLANVHPRWLFSALLAQQVKIGKSPLSLANLQRYENVKWRGRRWKAVNPTEESKANQMDLDMLQTSESRLADEMGVDIEDVIREQAAVQKLRTKHGLQPNHYSSPAAANNPPQPAEGSGNAEDVA